MKKTFILKIYRGNPGEQYWEEFELPLVPYLNITSALMEIQMNPVNRQGMQVAPVVWEQGCLEEVCGSCSMLINGRPRQACTARVEPILKETNSDTITLAPFTKFPLVRDLIVDRSIMFENLKKASAWIDADGAFDRGPGPKISQEKQEVMYSISKCITCGCCMEACPQTNSHSTFMGPAVIAQVRLFNMNPTGAMHKERRIRVMMEDGGVGGCGNAQNCQKVCPKDVPLLDSISAIGRATTAQAFKDIFGLPD